MDTVKSPIDMGSSPHTRGLRTCQEYAGADVGIIPAYAGTTRFHCGRFPCSRDHPRIRGDYDIGKEQPSEWAGSSPHTRGLLFHGLQGQVCRGIIPAYAGTTNSVDMIVTSIPGSSPHTRGLPTSAIKTNRTNGIIPAYAGTTYFFLYTRRWRWDHPRIRGDYAMVLLSVSPTLGSSPHTRGLLHNDTCT